MQKGDVVSWPEAETHRDQPKNKAVNQLLILSRWFPANLLFKSLPLHEQKSASEDTVGHPWTCYSASP